MLNLTEEAEGAARTLPAIGYILTSHMLRAVWTTEHYLCPYIGHQGLPIPPIHIDPNLAVCRVLCQLVALIVFKHIKDYIYQLPF